MPLTQWPLNQQNFHIPFEFENNITKATNQKQGGFNVSQRPAAFDKLIFDENHSRENTQPPE